jgi:hypothetical protein
MHGSSHKGHHNRLDETYYCTVDSVDPGAVIARAKGATREEAETNAIAKAKERIQQTKILGDGSH